MKLFKKFAWLLLCLLLLLFVLVFFEFREVMRPKSNGPVEVKVLNLPKPK